MKTNKQNQTSDFIPYEVASLKGNELLWGDKQTVIGFYILFSINTGFRVGDVLEFTHEDLMTLKPGDYIATKEEKTEKTREVQINEKIVTAY